MEIFLALDSFEWEQRAGEETGREQRVGKREEKGKKNKTIKKREGAESKAEGEKE